MRHSSPSWSAWRLEIAVATCLYCRLVPLEEISQGDSQQLPSLITGCPSLSHHEESARQGYQEVYFPLRRGPSGGPVSRPWFKASLERGREDDEVVLECCPLADYNLGPLWLLRFTYLVYHLNTSYLKS